MYENDKLILTYRGKSCHSHIISFRSTNASKAVIEIEYNISCVAKAAELLYKLPELPLPIAENGSRPNTLQCPPNWETLHLNMGRQIYLGTSNIWDKTLFDFHENVNITPEGK